MRKFLSWFLVGVLLSMSASALAQKLSRTTPMAGGPSGQTFIGDYDSGMIAVPSSLTVLTTSTVLVTNIFCEASVTGTIQITDNQGSPQTYVPTVTLTAPTTQQFLNVGKGLIMQGIKWRAASGTINCQIAGYF